MLITSECIIRNTIAYFHQCFLILKQTSSEPWRCHLRVTDTYFPIAQTQEFDFHPLLNSSDKLGVNAEPAQDLGQIHCGGCESPCVLPFSGFFFWFFLPSFFLLLLSSSLIFSHLLASSRWFIASSRWFIVGHSFLFFFFFFFFVFFFLSV